MWTNVRDKASIVDYIEQWKISRKKNMIWNIWIYTEKCMEWNFLHCCCCRRTNDWFCQWIELLSQPAKWIKISTIIPMRTSLRTEKSQSCFIDDNVINEIIGHILTCNCRQIVDFLHTFILYIFIYMHIEYWILISPINSDLFTDEIHRYACRT